MIKIDNRGSVTVYIILVFSVLCILITSVMALMRYQSERTNSQLSLDIAEESAFSKYYRPLLDNYGMFYYISEEEESLAADIMSYFVKNQEGISHMLSITPSNLDVYETCYAMDNNADNVKSQMESVIKDTFAEKAVNSLISRFKELSTGNTENSGKIDSFQKEVKQAENDAEKEKDMLRLLKLVEGITVSGDKIRCEKVYAKSALAGKVTATNAGIDSKAVWNAVKGNSWDMTKYLSELSKKAQKGSEGKAVSYSVAEAKKWRLKLEKILDKTKEAKYLADSINGIKNGICNPDIISAKLEANEKILQKFISLGSAGIPVSADDWRVLYSQAEQCIDALKGYHVKDIVFDYSTLNLTKTDNPVDNTDGNINDMLSFLMGDSDDISENTVAESKIYENLKSDERYITDSEENKATDYIDFADTGSLDDMLDRCRGSSYESNDGNNVTDKIYFGIYTDKFFKEYEIKEKDKSNESEEKMNHALRYEKEYLINADISDRDNLKAVVGRILFIRTGTSLVYLISDSESRELAYAAAACIVGFTGLDALVRCVQYMILAIWSYQDACVDTGALLAGHSVPVVKNKNSLNIRYEEVVLFGKDMLRNKINSYERHKGLSYEDYIKLFIMALPSEKILYRCMDLIQFNMKNNYDNAFSFQKAVYGIKARLTCEKPFYCVTEGEYYYR